MFYTQICLIGLVILAIPLFSRFHSKTADWRVFRILIVVTMLDLICETATWLLNGQTFVGAYPLIYAMNLLTILLQPVMGYLWLVYVACRLEYDMRTHRLLMAIGLIPLVLNSVLLLTNHQTGFVFEIVDGFFVRGKRFWVDVFSSFLYPVIATGMALCYARKEPISAKRREAFTLSRFLILPVGGAIIQLCFYGTFIFLIGFALALLIMFVKTQSNQITRDYLTKTNNRASLMLDFEHKRKQVDANKALYLFIIDIDRFKQFNDRFGHAIGDRVLVDVAERLKRACDQEPCFLARIGGDEFCILLLSGDESAAPRISQRIDRQFEGPACDATIPIPISISVGYAKCLSSTETIDQLITRADQMMYANKKRHADERGEQETIGG